MLFQHHKSNDDKIKFYRNTKVIDKRTKVITHFYIVKFIIAFF